MHVIDVDVDFFCEVLKKESFSIFRKSEETLVCVSGVGLDYVGIHLIPPHGMMNVLFCESWFGASYREWSKDFVESKKMVGKVNKWMKKNNTPLGEYGRDALYFPISVHAPRTCSMVPRDFLLKFGLFCQKDKVYKAIKIFKESEKDRRVWALDEGADFGDIVVDHGLQYYRSSGLGVMPLLPGVEDAIFPSKKDRDVFLEHLAFSINVLKIILNRIKVNDSRIVASAAFNIRGNGGLSRGINNFSFIDNEIYREYNSALLDVCLELNFPFVDEFYFFGENSVELNNLSAFRGDDYLWDKFQYYKKVALERSYWIPDGLLGGL